MHESVKSLGDNSRFFAPSGNAARGFQLLAGSKAGSFTAKALSSGKLSQAVNSARSPAAIRSFEARILIAMAA